MAYRVPIVVRFGDCDPAGLVYYPRYFHFFHTAMEELFAGALGITYPELTGREGLGFPAVDVACEFRRPLRYGDPAAIEVAVARLGTTSCTFRFRLFVGEESEARAEARLVTVCVDLASTTKRPLPAALAGALAAHLVRDEP